MSKQIRKTIPPMNILPKTPLIGSGKISRRVVFQLTKKKKDFSTLLKSRVNYFPGPISKKACKKPILFQTSAAKIIFYHWNNMGHPLTKHRPELNKTTAIAVERINKNIKSYGKEKILYAIDLLSEIFNVEWFKYRLLFAKRKISLPEFFRYDKNTMKYFNRGFSDIPISWFKEVLKGEQYLKGKYNIKLKDKHPEITNKLLDVWKEYINFENVNVDDINQFIICSKKLWEFSKKNKIDCLAIIGVIDTMLNKSKSFKPKHSGYLTNKIFWESQIPDELVKANLIFSKRKIVV